METAANQVLMSHSSPHERLMRCLEWNLSAARDEDLLLVSRRAMGSQDRKLISDAERLQLMLACGKMFLLKSFCRKECSAQGRDGHWASMGPPTCLAALTQLVRPLLRGCTWLVTCKADRSAPRCARVSVG